MGCSNYTISNINLIKGNGKIIEKTISISDITSIENTGIFNIYVKQGEKEELKIETDENIISFVTYTIKGNTIYFGSKEGIQGYKPSKSNIYVVLKDIVEVYNLGVGDISIENFTSKNKINIHNSGVGGIILNNFNAIEITLKNSGAGFDKFQGKTNLINIHSSGVGSIDTYNLQADTVFVHSSGVGSINVYAEKELTHIAAKYP